MRGTTVVDGHGTMRVLHVGDATEIGKVARQSTEDNLEPTPTKYTVDQISQSNRKNWFYCCRPGFPYLLREKMYCYILISVRIKRLARMASGI